MIPVPSEATREARLRVLSYNPEVSRSGLILFAHGARDPRWAEPFERLRTKVEARQPDVAVALAYLERMAPDLAGAVNDLVARGCASLVIVPVFLGQGGHVRDDLSALVASAAAAHPSVAFDVAIALGEDDSVLDALAAACIRELARPR